MARSHHVDRSRVLRRSDIWAIEMELMAILDILGHMLGCSCIRDVGDLRGVFSRSNSGHVVRGSIRLH